MAFDLDLKRAGFAGQIKRDEILAPYVAYKIGGPADWFLLPQTEEDLPLVFEIAKKYKLPVTTIGCGSNLLVRDGGIEGCVLYLGPLLPSHVAIAGSDKDWVYVQASASGTKAELLEFAIDNNLSGLEFSAGIPGTLGGAVFMNAGTKWGSYSEVLVSVRFYQEQRGFYEKSIEELGLKYRGHGEELFSDGAIVVSVKLRLRKVENSASIIEKVDEILVYRGTRQPLERPSCGSVFKNPENSEKGAGRLIEACELKGLQIGQAQISLKHANFILNLGGAKSSDVEALIAHAQKTVLHRFNISLLPEVIILGRQAPFATDLDEAKIEKKTH